MDVLIPEIIQVLFLFCHLFMRIWVDFKSSVNRESPRPGIHGWRSVE